MDESIFSESPFDDEEEMDEEGEVYRTYHMDFQNKRIIGKTDGLEAVKQNMFKAMQTRRYAYEIYDDQYGCDIMNKIGNMNLDTGYFESDIPTMIEDTFLNMSEITSVEEMEFEIFDRDSLHITFPVATIFGDTIIEGDIDNG